MVSVISTLLLIFTVLGLAVLAQIFAAEPSGGPGGVSVWPVLVPVMIKNAFMAAGAVGLFLGRKWGWYVLVAYFVYAVGKNVGMAALTAAYADAIGDEVGRYLVRYCGRVITHGLFVLALFKGSVCHFVRLERHRRNRRLGTAALSIPVVAVFTYFSGTSVMETLRESAGQV